jgi:hypothetical protein
MIKIKSDSFLSDEITEKILRFCYQKNRTLQEISDYLKMCKSVVKSSYLYPLIRAEKIISVNTKFRTR